MTLQKLFTIASKYDEFAEQEKVFYENINNNNYY